MAKIRVHELAKELGIASKEMVNTLQDLGLDVKNHMSTMEDSQASWVKKRLAGQQNQAEKIQVPSGGTDAQNENIREENQVTETRRVNRRESESKPYKPPKEAVRKQPQGNKNHLTPSRPNPLEQNKTNGRKPAAQIKGASKGAGVAQQFSRPGGKRQELDQSQKDSKKVETKKVSPGKKAASLLKTDDNLVAPGQNGRATKGTDSGKAPKAKGAVVRRDFSRPRRKNKHRRKKEEPVFQVPELISLGTSVQVRELAEMLGKSSAEIMKKLMELGIMATINQEIEFETAEMVANLFDVRVEREIGQEEKILGEIIDTEESLRPRSPIVTVMGHVDHGKTSLLDRIRKSDVASAEAGGITQHIGAYQVTVNGNRITFIDTPGHEAFTAMRARGANLTDIVILVVAVDDGVMPQTVEAINHIKAAGVPFLVALNKIDKPEGNPDRVMQQLTEYNIVAEEWGGDTMFIPVSAKTGYGIENLLDMVLLIAEMNEIKANPERAAEGVVIEGKLDKGKGAVATILVLKGTLRVGDYIICGINWCKVRAMTDYKGSKVDAAYPSMPVEISGWSDVPEAGEKVLACEEKIAKEIASIRITDKKLEDQKQSSRVSLDDFFKKMQDVEVKELNLIVKGDVQGSVEALEQSLLRLSTDEVKVSVIHSAVGAISETDVLLASASNAIIVGFNVRPDVKARKHAEDENIDVRLYRVIYEVIDDVKKAMVGLLEPQYREKYVGRAEIRALFRVPNVGTIGGSYVIDGKIQRNTNVRVLRNGVIIYEGKLSSLKRFKDDVKEVAENYECGIGIKDYNDIKEGDIIEAYSLEEIAREL